MVTKHLTKNEVFNLGKEVVFAMPHESSVLKPSETDIKIAADKLGISRSDAKKTLAYYNDGHTWDKQPNIKAFTYLYSATNEPGDLLSKDTVYASDNEKDGELWQNALRKKYLIRIRNPQGNISEGYDPKIKKVTNLKGNFEVKINNEWKPLAELPKPQTEITGITHSKRVSHKLPRISQRMPRLK